MNIPQTTSNHPHAERAYLHTMIAGAFLPFFQSLMLGAVVAIATWLIAALVFDAIDPHKPAILFGVLAWAFMLFRLLRHWINLTTITDFIRDVADDGQLNDSIHDHEVQPEAPILRIQLIKNDGHISDEIKLPASREQMTTLAMGLHNGMPFSEKMWTGSGKPFSSNQFRSLRDVMLKRGLAEYVNEDDPRQGICLTDAGQTVLDSFLPHSPIDESVS